MFCVMIWLLVTRCVQFLKNLSSCTLTGSLFSIRLYFGKKFFKSTPFPGSVIARLSESGALFFSASMKSGLWTPQLTFSILLVTQLGTLPLSSPRPIQTSGSAIPSSSPPRLVLVTLYWATTGPAFLHARQWTPGPPGAGSQREDTASVLNEPLARARKAIRLHVPAPHYHGPLPSPADQHQTQPFNGLPCLVGYMVPARRAGRSPGLWGKDTLKLITLKKHWVSK